MQKKHDSMDYHMKQITQHEQATIQNFFDLPSTS